MIIGIGGPGRIRIWDVHPGIRPATMTRRIKHMWYVYELDEDGNLDFTKALAILGSETAAESWCQHERQQGVSCDYIRVIFTGH